MPSRLQRDDWQELLQAPCELASEFRAYRQDLIALIAARTRETAKDLEDIPAPDWMSEEGHPAQVSDFAAVQGVRPPSPTEWRGLATLQRFVLVKLSRDNHDNVNFIPALKELACSSLELAPDVAQVVGWTGRWKPRRPKKRLMCNFAECAEARFRTFQIGR